MTINGKAYIAGAYEHPARYAPDKSVTQLHAECALGALRDAGLSIKDVDGYFCAGDAPGGSPLSMAEYLNLDLKWIDGTELGGCSYMVHVRHAALAIAQGKCSVALITLAGKPKSSGMATGTVPRELGPERPETPWDRPYRSTITGIYGMLAQRHMHEYGTTSEQLAAVKVAAAHHAQYNELAALRKPVTVEDVLASPVIASPLHRLDCCVITDGGGALVLTSPEIAKRLSRPLVKIIGAGKHQDQSRRLHRTHNVGRGRQRQAGVRRGGHLGRRREVCVPVRQLHHHGADAIGGPGLLQEGPGGPLCRRGKSDLGPGKTAVQHGWRRPVQQPPLKPGGMTKVIEAVRQLRGEAHPAVQVPDCNLALASGPGMVMGVAHAHSTLILERE